MKTKENRAAKAKVHQNTPKSRKPDVTPVKDGNHPAAVIQGTGRYPGILTRQDVMVMQRTIGNQAVGRLMENIMRPSNQPAAAQGQRPSGPGINTPGFAIQRKTYEKEAASINSEIRGHGIEAGNRVDEIIASNGRSYAGVALVDFLYNSEESGSWLDKMNLNKRSTLAYDIKAANCNQYASLAYCKAVKKTDADNVTMEYDSSHAYSAIYDNEDAKKPGNHAIIDPWVRVTGLRKDQQAYYQGREKNQHAKMAADHSNWYVKGYTGRLKKKYSRQEGDKTFKRHAAYGKKIAKEQQSGTAEHGLY